MKEYELYVPATYNDGSLVADEDLDEIAEALLEEFGGYTFFPQWNEGRWRMGDAVFHDKIVIYRVLAKDAKQARRFFRKLKERPKVSLEQEEILIVEKNADAL